MNDINTDGKPKSYYKGSNLSVISEKVFFFFYLGEWEPKQGRTSQFQSICVISWKINIISKDCN